MPDSPYIPPPRTMMEIFRCLPEGTRVELIENSLVLYTAPYDIWHQVRNEIWFDLSQYIKQHKSGRILIAPYDVYLDETNAFHPDISFVSNERLPLIKEMGLFGAPDLVIEILTEHSAKYDFHDKKNVYERTGVTEYWIVDPTDKKTIGFYLFDGKYEEFFKGEGKIEFRVLDWKIDFNNMEYLFIPE